MPFELVILRASSAIYTLDAIHTFDELHFAWHQEEKLLNFLYFGMFWKKEAIQKFSSVVRLSRCSGNRVKSILDNTDRNTERAQLRSKVLFLISPARSLALTLSTTPRLHTGWLFSPPTTWEMGNFFFIRFVIIERRRSEWEGANENTQTLNREK